MSNADRAQLHFLLFYSTKIIKNQCCVNALLKSEGFAAIDFITTDNVTLSCCFQEKERAQYNLIIYMGFIGRIADALPFAAMFADQPCNLLFIEGRNQSWRWWLGTQILHFGDYGHKDMQAAIEYVHKKNNKPIFLLGTCTGAFYAANAILDYQATNSIRQYNIQGLIFDSGWSSPAKTMPVAMKGIIGTFCDKLCGRNGRYCLENRPWLFGKAIALVHTCIDTLYAGFLHYFVKQVDRNKNLLEHIEKNIVPLLFIHSQDDYITPIDQAKELYAKSNNAEAWWIEEKSFHALHYLKFKDLYKQRLVTFINKHLKLDQM